MKIIDMHADVILQIMRERVPLRSNSLQLDLMKLKKADYLLQNFAMFVDCGEYKEPYNRCLEMIAVYNAEIAKNSDIIAPVYTYSDIAKNEASGRMSALLTIEEGGACEGSVEKLRELYRLGARMLTITWNYKNELGYSNRADDNGAIKEDESIPNTTGGLTETGIEFLSEMETLGMIPDVSHLSDAGFYDVLDHTKKPFVASHSNARAICGHCRNLTDDMVRKLAERGGVMGMNFAANFVTDMTYEEWQAGKDAGMERVVEHMKHIRNVGGYECIGFGSDFDGIPVNPGIPDASHMQRFVQVLWDSGFSYTEIEAIFAGNVLRVYKECL